MSELKLGTLKDPAIDRFRTRLNVLRDLVEHRIELDQFDRFIETIAGWRGEHLLLDPAEIFDGSAPRGGNEAAFRRILRAIAKVDASSGDIRLAISCYVDLATIDSARFEADILGCAYA